MKRYYLGADVGGTKTHVLIADEEGKTVGFGQGGPGNPSVVGADGLQRALADAVDRSLATAQISKDQITGAGFGIAGYDWPADKEIPLRAIQTLGLTSPIELVNDTILGLIAGSPQGWGVAVVSGTGCNARGWDKTHQKEGRVTGESWAFGEGAGATQLMMKVMEAINYEWIKRGPQTQLTPMMMDYVGADSPADLLKGIAQGYYPFNASAAPLVFQVAANGDFVANEIIQWAGRELGELANAVIRQLEFETMTFDVVLIGSMYKGGKLLIEPMQQTIHSLAPAARLVPLALPPAVGGVLLGMQADGFNPSDSVRKALDLVAVHL